MSEAIDIHVKRCPVCGKNFAVMWPDQWAYKRGHGHNWKYICSWKCVRAWDKEKNKGDEKPMVKLSEKNRKAVEIALGGGDPVAYLREHGSTNASQMWANIRNQLKEKEPDTYEKLPADLKERRKTNGPKPMRPKKKESETPEGSLADAMAGMKNAVESFLGPVETPERPATDILKGLKRAPLVYDGLTVREVEGNFGRYRRSDTDTATYIDFEPKDFCDVMSLTTGQWKSFREEHDKAAAVLGVEI